MTCQIAEYMWGKKSIHIANVHDIYGAELIGGYLDNYQTRIIGLLASNHKLILPERHRQAATELLDYFISIGFDHLDHDNLIWIDDKHTALFETMALIMAQSDTIKALHDPEYTRIVPFFASERIQKLADQYNKNINLTHSMASLLNDKAQFRKLLKQANIRTPGAYTIIKDENAPMQKALEIYDELYRQGYHQFALILPKSCSGAGIHRFTNTYELKTIIDHLDDQEEFLIDPWFNDAVAAPSFQFYLADRPENDILIGLTDQLLDDCYHLGNIFPSKYAYLEQVQTIASQVIEMLRKEGARGMMGVDLLIREVQGQIIPYVLEINARQTGAVYAGFLAYELRNQKLKPWIGHNNIDLPEGTTLHQYHNYLKANHIAYNKGDKEGILITCNGNLPENKIMILILADTTERLYELLEIAERYH